MPTSPLLTCFRLIAIGWTPSPNWIEYFVFSKLMSLNPWVKSGWLIKSDSSYSVPSFWKWCAPTTIRKLFASTGYCVQCAAVITHWSLRIVPPQRWKNPDTMPSGSKITSNDRSEIWYGNCPRLATDPPIIRSFDSHGNALVFRIKMASANMYTTLNIFNDRKCTNRWFFFATTFYTKWTIILNCNFINVHCPWSDRFWSAVSWITDNAQKSYSVMVSSHSYTLPISNVSIKILTFIHEPYTVGTIFNGIFDICPHLWI